MTSMSSLTFHSMWETRDVFSVGESLSLSLRVFFVQGDYGQRLPSGLSAKLPKAYEQLTLNSWHKKINKQNRGQVL